MSEAKKDGGTRKTQFAQNARSAQRRKALKMEKILQDALEAVAANRTPYLNGSEHLGTLEVPDPLEEQEIIRAGRGHFVRRRAHTPRRTRVVSLRDDPIGQMAHRGQLGNPAETDFRLKAARLWQRYYEVAEIGGARGIDPTRDVVDGGRFEMPDTDASLRAQAKLKAVRYALGIIGDRIVTWVLGHKYSLRKVLLLLDRSGRMEQKALGSRFRECLDTVGEEFGLAFGERGARGPRRARDKYDEDAKYAGKPDLHRALRLGRAIRP
jgi:hypothetical protein